MASRHGKRCDDAAESKTLGMHGNSKRENRESLWVSLRQRWRVIVGVERSANTRDRFAKFGLKLHPEKTRLIEFGRHAAERRKRRGEGRPETFDFLGFTHVAAKTRAHGRFTVHRYSISKRPRATLHKISEELRKRMHAPMGETGRWLRHVVRGWLNYHSVPFNSRRMNRFFKGVTRLWLSALRRRGQRGRRRWTWERMACLVARHLPRPKVAHPYPHQRFYARLKGRAV